MRLSLLILSLVSSRPVVPWVDIKLRTGDQEAGTLTTRQYTVCLCTYVHIQRWIPCVGTGMRWRQWFSARYSSPTTRRLGSAEPRYFRYSYTDLRGMRATCAVHTVGQKSQVRFRLMLGVAWRRSEVSPWRIRYNCIIIQKANHKNNIVSFSMYLKLHFDL